MLTYSTELEEIAYSKDAQALLKSAAMSLKRVASQEEFFHIGQVLAAADEGTREYAYFTWHGGTDTFLFFKKDGALKKIRSLPDRSHEDTLNAR